MEGRRQSKMKNRTLIFSRMTQAPGLTRDGKRLGLVGLAGVLWGMINNENDSY
jgi:hypothetical protein